MTTAKSEAKKSAGDETKTISPAFDNATGDVLFVLIEAVLSIVDGVTADEQKVITENLSAARKLILGK